MDSQDRFELMLRLGLVKPDDQAGPPGDGGSVAGLATIEQVVRFLSQATGFSARVVRGRIRLCPTYGVPRFCMHIQQTALGSMRCAECALQAAKLAERTGEAVSYKCHAGLYEIAHPIVCSDQALGTLYVGQVRLADGDSSTFDHIIELAKRMGHRPSELIAAYQELPMIREHELRIHMMLASTASSIIGAIAELASKATNNSLSASELLDTVSIIDWLHSSKKRFVLILGKDTPPELGILREVQRVVAEHGYEPVLVKDHDDLGIMSNEEKVMAYALLSRFVIIENSFPAGQIDECRLCATNRIVAPTLRQEGKGSSFMVTDYSVDYPLMKEFVYCPGRKGRDVADVVAEVVEWAEATLMRRQEAFCRIYPWRQSDGPQVGS